LFSANLLKKFRQKEHIFERGDLIDQTNSGCAFEASNDPNSAKAVQNTLLAPLLTAF
jgi:hypothetical protein